MQQSDRNTWKRRENMREFDQKYMICTEKSLGKSRSDQLDHRLQKLNYGILEAPTNLKTQECLFLSSHSCNFIGNMFLIIYPFERDYPHRLFSRKRKEPKKQE